MNHEMCKLFVKSSKLRILFEFFFNEIATNVIKRNEKWLAKYHVMRSTIGNGAPTKHSSRLVLHLSFMKDFHELIKLNRIFAHNFIETSTRI